MAVKKDRWHFMLIEPFYNQLFKKKSLSPWCICPSVSFLK
uniref:Uncharacterized protein n=1 Tax=Anguilla anguilla TaxID=7936 RepID=A0A0E9XL50_ANGAN